MAAIEKVEKEQMYKVTVHKGQDDGQMTHVPVSVNGTTWLLMLGKEVVVPNSVVEVLRNALMTVYRQSKDDNLLTENEVSRYPFSAVPV